MDAIDRIEALLGAAERPRARHARQLSESIVDVCEFLAVRWGIWRSKDTDILRELPPPPSGSMLEGALRRTSGIALLDLLGKPGASRSAAFDGVRICEIPMDAEGWEAGGLVSVFEEEFKDSLVEAGYPTTLAHGLAGALHELASNASEHSSAPIPPIIAFSVQQLTWGFAIIDVGRGARSSLADNPKLPALNDELEALRLAVQPGISRSGASGRGLGFRHVFKALVDRSCRIRIRSGCGLALWSGPSPTHQNLRWRALDGHPGFQVGISRISH